MDDSEFAARLTLVRWKMRWNAKEAARECGVPAASWASWESGRLPRRYTDVCKQISDATGADHFWLLTGNRQAVPPPAPTPAAPTPPAHPSAHRPNPQRPRPKPRPKRTRATSNAVAVA